MKKNSAGNAKTKAFTFLFIMSLCFLRGFSQTDTLHLIYHHTQNKAHDTTLAHIDRWIKTLNGKHQDITVIGYYPSPNFKPFAQERVDEMFLVLNRKARTLFTFGEFSAKRGKDYQRTMVDIIYKPTVSPEEAAAAAAKTKAATDAAKADEKKKKDDEKAAKEGEKKSTAKETDDKKKTKSEVAAEQTEKGGKGKETEKKGKETDKKGGEKEGKEADDEDKDVAFSTVVTYNEGYAAEYAEIKYIQRAKCIVASTGKQSIDDNFLNAVKDYWKVNSDLTVMPYEEAQKYCKEHKKDTVVILSVAQVKTWFTVKSFGYSYRILKIGRALAIENTKGKVLYKHFIPTDKERGVTKECLVFGMTTMNYVFNYMLANKIANSTRVPFLVEENAKELKNTTLVISEKQMHPKFPIEDLSKYYTEKVSIVSDQEAKDVILKGKDVAYVMPVKLPNPSATYFYYVVNGATGKIYLYDEGGFTMSINVGVVKNLNPAQSGYVDKANFERFQKAIDGDPDREAKRAEKAGKEKDKVEKQEKEQADKKAKAEADAKEKAEKKAKKDEEKKSK